MKKFNAKQLKAISSMNSNLDELDNKPRRLFDSLKQYAEAFVQDKEQQDIDDLIEFAIKEGFLSAEDVELWDAEMKKEYYIKAMLFETNEE